MYLNKLEVAVQMSNMWMRHHMKHVKGNHCRIAMEVFIVYGDIRNTYITPSKRRGANYF